MSTPPSRMRPLVFGLVVYVVLAAVLAVGIAVIFAPRWAALAPLLALCIAHPATRLYERRGRSAD